MFFFTNFLQGGWENEISRETLLDEKSPDKNKIHLRFNTHPKKIQTKKPIEMFHFDHMVDQRQTG